PDAKPLPVKLLYRDRVRDLALLAVDSPQKPLPLAADKPTKGHLVTVVKTTASRANPGSVALREGLAVSKGTLEGLVMRSREAWYHLKADAAPGNSGGPVIDRKTGEVVGVLAFGIMPNRGGVRTAHLDTFCIPATFVEEAQKKVESA